MGCDCAEGRYTDTQGGERIAREKRRPIPPVHNCGYVKARDALIPEAEVMANTDFPEPSHPTDREFIYWRICWSQSFIRAMKILAAQRIPRKPSRENFTTV
jgi:hypothetical protein